MINYDNLSIYNLEILVVKYCYSIFTNLSSYSKLKNKQKYSNQKQTIQNEKEKLSIYF